MMGEYAVQLGNQIIEARADLNEALVIQGATHPSTRQAEAALKLLKRDARQTFSDSKYR
jgi:hypothetical protein